MFYIGCPVWGTKEWAGNFFPPRTPTSEFLRLYSRQLTTVEGNTTFYATPSEETIARWAQETPATFRFCPKIARTISHAPRLDTTQAETLSFVDRMCGLGTQLGPLFLQLPPSFAPTHLDQLQAFLDFWPAKARLAVEVRHPAFYKEPQAAEVNTLLEHYNAARVMMDTRPQRTGPTEERKMLEARERKPDLPLQVALTTDFAFLRYIGHPHLDVNQPFLESWAQQLGQWLRRGTTLYVFCHCPIDAQAPVLCAELYRRVRPVFPLPPLPWQPSPLAVQPELFS